MWYIHRWCCNGQCGPRLKTAFKVHSQQRLQSCNTYHVVSRLTSKLYYPKAFLKPRLRLVFEQPKYTLLKNVHARRLVYARCVFTAYAACRTLAGDVAQTRVYKKAPGLGIRGKTRQDRRIFTGPGSKPETPRVKMRTWFLSS